MESYENTFSVINKTITYSFFYHEGKELQEGEAKIVRKLFIEEFFSIEVTLQKTKILKCLKSSKIMMEYKVEDNEATCWNAKWSKEDNINRNSKYVLI